MFTLTLISFESAQKLSLIKLVKERLGLGLKESKELVEKTPSILMQQVKKEDTDEIIEVFLKAGGKVEKS